MPTVFEKLNFKGATAVVVLNAPREFEPVMSGWTGVRIHRSAGAGVPVHFGMAFGITQADVDAAAKALTALTVVDPVVWLAYPKQSSKRYRCEFNRDTGWSVLGGLGFEPVRQVAIDEDWSALRFRRVECIKSLTRAPGHAISRAGKARAARKRR